MSRTRSGGRAAARFAAALSAALFLTSCNDSGGTQARLRAELEAARARWQDAGPTGYAVTERRLCFCPAPSEWTVVVASGQPSFISSVVPAGGSVLNDREREMLALDLAMSVEEMFDWIEGFLGTGAGIEVTFDPDLGFPASVSVDPVPGAVDDEISWLLSDVTPTGSCAKAGCQDALRVMLHAPAGGFVAGDYTVTVGSWDGGNASCDFGLTLGGPCPYSVCVSGGASCAVVPLALDEILVPFPFAEGGFQVTVEIDGRLAVGEELDAELVRSQPNGALCPPVCWSADLEVVLP